jgi:hypothetical protein
VLAKEPSRDVQVFVVWVNRGTGDNRESIDTTLLEDERVQQYWDRDGITGTAFAAADLGSIGQTGFVYDVYYVFGSDAAWGDEPGPVEGAGGTVVDAVDRMLAEIRAQL